MRQGFSPREGIWSMETLEKSTQASRRTSFSPREGIWSMETSLQGYYLSTGDSCFSPREGIWSMETWIPITGTLW